MEKIDLKKVLKEQYTAKVGKPNVVNVPPQNFLMIDGKGYPGTSQEYTDAIQALYPLAYTIKFMCKAELGRDFGVMPLEGQWWADDMANFASLDKNEWKWTAMILQPDFVTQEIFQRAVEQVARKKNPAALGKVRLEKYDEGRAAQVMYIGAYADETETIQSLHEFIKQQGGSLGPKTKNHHEIYLSDPRRVEPAKLKTIIRQPF